MNMQIAELGSVSSGTMRAEDLIPRFVSVLDDLKQTLALGVKPGEEMECVKVVGQLDDLLGRIERDMAEENYYNSETFAYNDDLEELWDALEAFAPKGAYFGAHPGDGSDYGFWMSEDEDN